VKIRDFDSIESGELGLDHALDTYLTGKINEVVGMGLEPSTEERLITMLLELKDFARSLHQTGYREGMNAVAMEYYLNNEEL